MAGLVMWLTKLLWHQTGLEYDTVADKIVVSCNESAFNWSKGKTMSNTMYDYVKIWPCKIIVFTPDGFTSHIRVIYFLSFIFQFK